MSKCKACGAEIMWIKTRSGKNMPCNIEKVTVVTDSGDVIQGYMPHWGNCTAADSFRKEKK